MKIHLTEEQAVALSCHEIVAVHGKGLPQNGTICGEVITAKYNEKTISLRAVGAQRIEGMLHHFFVPTCNIL